MEQTKRFKPFDKVLVRDEIYPKWLCDFYSHYDDEKKVHITTTFTKVEDENILPYEGNEHLVGSTDEPDEEVRLEKGEWIFIFDDKGWFPYEIKLRKFDSITESQIKTFNPYSGKFCCWNYAIRISDFNPGDMEETKKHILCVRNGKIVKYEG